MGLIPKMKIFQVAGVFLGAKRQAHFFIVELAFPLYAVARQVHSCPRREGQCFFMVAAL